MLEWEGEALVGFPFDKYMFFPHCGHPFSRKLILKDQPYGSYWDGQRNGEVLQNGSVAKSRLRSNATAAFTDTMTVDSMKKTKLF